MAVGAPAQPAGRAGISAVMDMKDRETRDIVARVRAWPAAQWAAAILLAIFAGVLVRTAWMSDDAYITLRTVDNLVHGYGLTWNVAERVQAYTHPLWMLVLSAAYFVTRDAYFTTLLLSAAISLTVVGLVITRVRASWQGCLLAMAGLTLSKAFTDYSTSGLENPLTHLLLVLFFIILMQDGGGLRRNELRRIFPLSLLTALLALNRPDIVLFVAPAYLLALWQSRAELQQHAPRALGLILLGFLPLLAWEAFSLIYYGFLAPNTYFAKLSHGIDPLALVRQGLTYLVRSTAIDPLSSLLIIFGLGVAAWSRRPRVLAWAAGIILYLGYVVSIGGDFMSGRFLAAPVLGAMLVVASVKCPTLPKCPAPGRCRALNLIASKCPALAKCRALTLIAASLIIIVGLAGPYAPIPGTRFMGCDAAAIGPSGVSDERSCFYEGTGLLNQRQPPYPNQGLVTLGLEARQNPFPVHIFGVAGIFGYYAGPQKHLVDLNALADPLLARLPLPEDKPWRIGHFERLIPAGYLETLASGENKICSGGLAQYYDRLRTITRGPLLTAERLRTIWEMNTGQYDDFLAQYQMPGEKPLPDSELLCNAAAIVDVEFASGPHLRGYTISDQKVAPGGSLLLTLYWQGNASEGVKLATFVHVRPGPGQPGNPQNPGGHWAQDEHFNPGGRENVEFWRDQVYVDQVLLQLPAAIPPGEYLLEVGWFNPETGEQLEPKPETVQAPLSILWRSILLPSLQVE